MVCLLLESGYSKQEGAYIKRQIVDILVRSASPYREEPLQVVYT